MPITTYVTDQNYPIYTTGDQTISGLKNFNGGLSIDNNLFRSSQASGYLTGPGYTGNYDGGYFLGDTKLSQKTSRLVDSNFGNNWTAKMTDTNRKWYSISISSDGKYQTAVVFEGQIYISSDYGNTWNVAATPTMVIGAWRDVSISSDGKYQTAVMFPGDIYLSNDYGLSWGPAQAVPSYTHVAISSDGKYQAALSSGRGISISSNYGKTWTLKFSAVLSFNSLAMSTDGKYQAATVQNGQLYISSDYGNTWVAKDSSRY